MRDPAYPTPDIECPCCGQQPECEWRCYQTLPDGSTCGKDLVDVTGASNTASRAVPQRS